jgi:hypothetical protein
MKTSTWTPPSISSVTWGQSNVPSLVFISFLCSKRSLGTESDVSASRGKDRLSPAVINPALLLTWEGLHLMSYLEVSNPMVSSQGTEERHVKDKSLSNRNYK